MQSVKKMRKKILYIIVFLVGLFLPATILAEPPAKKFVVVIDAGHGAHDAGAVNRKLKIKEKDINLKTALKLGEMIEKNCPDVKVVYTRKKDVFVELHRRAQIANNAKADLFISIHTNAMPKGHISRGMETYTLGMHRAADNLAVAKRENEVILYEKDYKQRYQGFDPNSSESYIMFEFIQDKNMAQSVELAKFIQRRTCAQAGRINKGVKQAGFLVLRETSMPSCLVELGFISTSDEERFLHSQSGVSQMGQGIYQAFLDYKRKYAPTTTTPYRVPQQEVVKESKREKRRREKAEQEAREAAEKAAREQQEAAEKAAREAVEKQQPQDTVATVQQPVPVVTPKQQVPVAPPQQTEVKQPAPVASAPVASAPVFKVQILASSVKLKSTSPQLKGQSDAECYQEGGMYKYTVGASTNYNEIFRLRKELLDKFPQAFIIAFKDGQKMDVRQAIQEFKNRK